MSGSDDFLVSTTTATTTAFTTVPPTFELLTSALGEIFVRYLNYLDALPGGSIVLRYIKSSYKNDPVRSLFEYALFGFAVSYFLSSKKKENKADVVRLTQKEIDELVEEWKPMPLINDVTSEEKWALKTIPEVEGANISHIHLKGHDKKVVNMASSDFLNLNDSPAMKEAAAATIRDDGVGACGPPNFYGTQDVHVRLEEDLSRYLHTDQAILYGQDFITAGSVIPAFLKRGDLCVVDSGVNLAIQKALIVSRCDIEWYKHNDMESLENVLKELKPVVEKQKPLRRRFIITEGMFSNTGDLLLLPRIVELKNKYKYRLFVDEFLSIGVIGKTGRGVAEHYDIPRSEIDITIGSMAMALASSGGFCVGVEPMVHHQRIQSIAYVFSAALPPYAAKVASQALKEIGDKLNSKGESVLISDLQEKTSFTHNYLNKSLPADFLKVISEPESPIIHVTLHQKYREKLRLPSLYGDDTFLKTGKSAKHLNGFDRYLNLESFLLQRIIDDVLSKSGILISRSKHTPEHENLPIPNPHLLIFVNTGVNKDELALLVETLSTVSKSILKEISSEAAFLNLENDLINY